MLFSVLIPVYNVEKYIRECIDSVLSQSEQDFEIVLCDDGSTDNSGAVCDEYQAKHPDKIRVVHKENEGPLLTRRRALKEAKGEWFVHLDSDDYMMPDALKELKDLINKNDFDMVVYDAKCVHFDGHVEYFEPDLEPDKIYESNDLKNFYSSIYSNSYLNSLCTKVFKRQLLDLDADYSKASILKSGEDIYQSYPLFDNAKKIYYFHKPLYIYMKREGSITGRFHKEFYLTRKILWERDDYYRNKWALGEEINSKVYKKRVSEIINYLSSLIKHCDKKEWLEVAQTIKEDGILQKSHENTDVKGRYNFYCKLLTKGRFVILKFLLKQENILLKLLRKK